MEGLSLIEHGLTAIIGGAVTLAATYLKGWGSRSRAKAAQDASAVEDYARLFADLRAELTQARQEGERYEREIRQYVDRLARLEVALEAMEQAHARVEAERDLLAAENSRLREELARR